ncbi:MAG: S-layer homology domain-containing protein [Candidatus Limnocylindria bacterium]
MPTHPRRLTGFLGAVVMAATILSATAPPVAAVGGSTLVAASNAYRASNGLGPVGLNAVIDEIAVERSQQMARANAMEHNIEYVRSRLNQEGICWSAMAEIIAWNSTGDYARFAEQWYTSTTGHREIMLGSYTHAGGGRERGSDGRYYATMVFVKLCGSTPTGPTAGFTDIGSSQFAADIKWLVAEKITSGCSADRFCPRAAVTRAQMASFLRRATGIPTSLTNACIDDDGSMHHADINGVAAAGITGGCTDVRFCPDSIVTRAQMASFLARALQLPPATRDWFRDDNGSMHEQSINRLAEVGITGGCTSGSFCPDASVTREQMAGFLRRAFND